MNIRLPAEWEPQDGILMAWPHVETDWADDLPHAEPVFIEIARTVSRLEKVLIVAPETGQIQLKLSAADALMENIQLLDISSNDTWARDFGPITVFADDRAEILDFSFNGWGNKFPAELDDKITRMIAAQGLFSTSSPRKVNMVLEGGSIDSDGKGNLLTTESCLLNPNRNPGLSQAEITEKLKTELGAQKIFWLKAGKLEGDDTDSHVDILARFAPDDTILFVACEDQKDAHFHELSAMQKELESFRTHDNQSFNLAPLPMPAPRFDLDGNRLAATYANFLVINNAVLVPTYDDPQDQIACDTIASVFPGREIIPINCTPLIYQGGSLHCSTMQFPQGALA